MSEEELRQVFEECGSIVSCKLIIDRETGRSKGFGFVEFSSQDEGQAAIDQINNTEVQGKTLVVNEARPQEKKSFNRPPRGRY
ncbi:MAG: hypothetical protein S4CHLAM45_08310 [Chlamydiales bacterium]|nr:hypothetical protein [Chlamydiales bacterium]MCH9620419.1 hypothetical protein [Chlamydiales bacterium]MCH9622935.1 hypothetical protein [Chlamydiales bacterium]